jgi:uncharacterized protein (DUF302 family)
MTDQGSTYALTRRVNLSFEEADHQIREALAEEGFGILTEIDVAATLRKKLDVDIPPYAILGACAPPLAHQAIQADPNIGLLLPCNVVVRDGGAPGTTIVQALDPVVQLGVTGNDALQPLAREVRARLERAVARVGDDA